MTKSKSITISNKIEELEKVSVFLEEFCENNEVPIKISNSFQIALDELLSNTIYYGYDDNKKGKIEILLKIEDKVMTAILTDDGKKFDPNDAPKPDLLNLDIESKKIGGVGIHIVKNMMDTFNYQRIKNKNVITLSKKFN